MIFALPQQSIQAFVAADKLGWKPFEYVTSVSIDPAVMHIVHLSSTQCRRRRDLDGVPPRPHEPDPNAIAPGVKLYLQIMKHYLPKEDPKAVAHIYGMMAAYTMVDALEQRARTRPRASLLHAAQHLTETNPFLLPGLRLTTTPTDYFPIGRTYLVRYLHGFWNVLGKPLKTS